MTLLWSPPVALSPAEARFLARLRNGKLYAFLREVRHGLFDAEAQQPLMDAYAGRTSGKDPVPPALLAMVLVLQGALHVSDEEAVERATSDRRWQLVLGTFDTDEEAPFTKSTLFAFRQRLIRHDLDVQLFDRVIAWARSTKGYSHTALRAAFDAAPLRGAGRVEDTFNLLGHAVREVLRTKLKDMVAGKAKTALEKPRVRLVASRRVVSLWCMVSGSVGLNQGVVGRTMRRPA